ncbi:hypothetical protein HMPREF0322_00519 [Desulfitobacterium hafniense DP7]|uniref:Uncharacterized protein n=1 Tax=Desulfitobacterium hafniense DP7 TaxID=537010 RepID=G9XHU3_DESHA|nr:hypothetical protein HMPREF0322_00519 [Desulfitobacterium hafniense DP7]
MGSSRRNPALFISLDKGCSYASSQGMQGLSHEFEYYEGDYTDWPAVKF